MANPARRFYRSWSSTDGAGEAGETSLVRWPTLDNMSYDEYIRYAKENNLGCPVCRSRDVIHEHLNQPSDDVIEQTAFCKDCESCWVEEFNMVTYSNVRYKREKVSE